MERCAVGCGTYRTSSGGPGVGVRDISAIRRSDGGLVWLCDWGSGNCRVGYSRLFVEGEVR